MKALVYHGPSQKAWEDKPTPTIQNKAPAPPLAATGPATAVVALRDAVGVGDGARLEAELDDRMAVSTQVLIVDLADVQVVDPAELSIIANAATRLQVEHLGSMVLRNASARLLGQLHLMRLDHKFELEI